MALLSSGKSKPLTKKWAGRAGTSLIGEIASQMEQGQHVGEGQLQWIPLAEIVPDLDQPRSDLQAAGITRESVTAHVQGQTNLADPSRPDRAELFERLVALAATIKEHSLIQPISLNRDPSGSGYVIEAGERRYLAHILIGANKIRAIVRAPIERDVKTRRQLVENLAREDLTLKDTIEGILAINAYNVEHSGGPLTAAALGRLIGVTERHARRMLAVAFGPDDLREAITSGQLKSIKVAARAASEVDPQIRRRLIEADEPPARTAAIPPNVVIEKPSALVKQRQLGRPQKYVTLGHARNGDTVRTVIKRCVSSDVFAARFGDVDWSDFKAVGRAWQTFWQSIEKTDTVSDEKKRR